MRDLPAIYRSATSQIGNSMARSMMRYVVLVQPVIFTTISYYMYRRSGIAGYGEYVVVGSALITLWMTILWSSATDIDRERWMGTFELLLIAPVPFPTILLGKILGNTALGILSAALTYGFGTLGLGVDVPLAHPGRVLLALAVAVASFVAFAQLLALLFTLSREANRIANGLSYPIWLVSGLLFPLTMLPGWARALGLAMPLAWAKEALRWAAVGEPAAATLWTGSYAAALAGLAACGAAYFAGAHLLYRHVLERKIRQLGQLGRA